MSMQFVDKCLSEDAIYTIENMVKSHISGNYKDVRNTILGYNSKNDLWESEYGEYIAKRHKYDIDPPITSHQMCGIKKISDIRNKKVDIFTKNNGMTFYEGDVYEYIRIYTDESIKRVLEVLFTLSKNVIEYRDIVDIIITEWNVNNIKDLSIDRPYIDHGICGDLHYYKLEVRKNSWADLKKITRYRGLNIRNTFKDAVIIFLESRSDILKENVPNYKMEIP